MSSSVHSVESRVKQAARHAGFDIAGVAPATDSHELQSFSEWIANGYAGEMKYLQSRNEQGVLKRSSLSRVAPWVRSVVVCAINYNTDHPYSTQVHQPDRGWISRYAWSREDYHEAVFRRLKQVEAALHEAAYDSQPDLITRSYVDTGPVVERVFAKYAGVGWIGKNTCIINQKLGSWLFLGVILASLELTHDVPAPDRCGTCTRCIQACPTDAILEPYKLDSNRCISYLTIEKRGSIAEDLRVGIGHHVFGCDICQDVCPWNRKAPVTTAPEFSPREGLVNPALAWLAEMSAEEFRGTFRSSPIRRAKHSGLRRNALVAIGNSGNHDFLPLAETLSRDEDESVAETARWAASRLQEST